MMRRQAFSLVELLVVMAIIGVLVSMTAMPIYSRTVGVARRVACASNLKHLRVLLETTREGEVARGEMPAGHPHYVKAYKWPGTVAAESEQVDVFVCPEDPETVAGETHPPLEYRSGIHWAFIPFDPAHYSCASREGVTDAGEPYTEYVIEEAAWLPSKFDHTPCHGAPQWSTNDGIWRVYHRSQGGRRKVVLTFYTCGLGNELYIGGEFHTRLLGTPVPRTFWFDYAMTSYAYNRDLEDKFGVGEDTIVLLDYPKAYVDATDSEIYGDLNSVDARRHLGKANVLYATGNVKVVGPASLYPDIDMAQWTADPMD